MELARTRLEDIPYEFLGNLDADITLVPEYYEKVIAKLEEDPSLGIAGGGVFSMNADGSLMGGGFIKPEFVGGPVQLFRRQCLEDIGGYAPYGHADSVAVAKAQMKGWKVRCFPDILAFHHELPRTTIREKVPDCYRMGQMDYIMGALLVFEMARCLMRVLKRPYGIAGASMFVGYAGTFISGRKKTVPKDIRKYMQKGQLRKMMLTLNPKK